MGEMREEEARGAGLEAGASGRAHPEKSGARQGTVLARRARACAGAFFEQRQLLDLSCTDGAPRQRWRHNKISADVREASLRRVIEGGGGRQLEEARHSDNAVRG